MMDLVSDRATFESMARLYNGGLLMTAYRLDGAGCHFETGTEARCFDRFEGQFQQRNIQ
jgi:hypothetical protein